MSTPTFQYDSILVSGTARTHSAHIVRHLSERTNDTWVLAVDREYNPEFEGLRNVVSIQVDLNPFTNPRGLAGVERELLQSIQYAQGRCRFVGIGGCVLSVGAYGFGALVDFELREQQRLVGLNICGHLEVIYSALRVNQKLGYASSKHLKVVEMGSVHALRNSPGRSLYAATKAMSLDLCISLSLGHEVSRVFYIAPGPIDTAMLHRNHWVSKERGPVEFFEALQAGDSQSYGDIFMRCDLEAVARATAGRADAQAVKDTMARYVARRKRQMNHEDGILAPADLAALVTDTICGESEIDCAYSITAPGGRLQAKKRPLAELVRS